MKPDSGVASRGLPGSRRSPHGPMLALRTSGADGWGFGVTGVHGGGTRGPRTFPRPRGSSPQWMAGGSWVVYAAGSCPCHAHRNEPVWGERLSPLHVPLKTRVLVCTSGPTWHNRTRHQWQCQCQRCSILRRWLLYARGCQGQRKQRWAAPSSMSGFRRPSPGDSARHHLQPAPQGICTCTPITTNGV